MLLTEKTHETTGRSKRPASFRIFVDLGNCPGDASGGQPDALLGACMLTVGRGLAPAESQHSVHIDNWLHP